MQLHNTTASPAIGDAVVLSEIYKVKLRNAARTDKTNRRILARLSGGASRFKCRPRIKLQSKINALRSLQTIRKIVQPPSERPASQREPALRSRTRCSAANRSSTMTNMSGSGSSDKPGQNQESQKGGSSQHSQQGQQGQQGNRQNETSNDPSRQGNKNQPGNQPGSGSGSGGGNR